MAFFPTSVLDPAVLNEQLKTLFAPVTASGSIATFDNGGDDIPVSEYECDIVAQQASGTPTPTDPLAITGFSQADITVCGKNLLDIAHVTSNSNAQYKAFGALISTNTPDGTLFLPQGTYTFSVSATMELINARDDNGDLITSDTSTNSLTFTLSKTTKLKITLSKGNGDWSNYTYQLEKSNQATTYEPYTGNLYTVAFGQTIYGGRLIYENGEWSIEADNDKKAMNTLQWYGSNGTFYSSAVADVLGDMSIYYDFLCSVYKPVNKEWSALDNGECVLRANLVTSGKYSLVIKDTAYTTASDFYNSLNSACEFTCPNPLITTPITSATRVKTISGNNNIYSNTGDCEVKYFTNKADSLAELIKAFVL